jgi:uncharacterized integral membrane protein (TIGR00697 family)
VGPFFLPAAIIIFPISYIISDVLTEVYGYSQARRVIWLGFICNLLAVVAILIGQVLPAAPSFTNQPAYEAILGSTPRFLIASFLAYLAGEFSNSFIMSKMKIATRGKWLWTRTIGSTVVGEGIDTVIALTIAFAGVLPWPILGIMILSHWLFKCLYETAATPLTYLVVNYLKRKEQLDVYDYKTDYNPLRI